VSSGNTFPVVGIGSSAGGVEALQVLFQNMPADSGMAFIVVSHLARDYQSLLPEIVPRPCPHAGDSGDGRRTN
jgi:two-component system, chemotaxis family, CheB/CheR fusion protein